MKLHGAKIKLDPAQKSMQYEENDWSIVPGTRLITHCPSRVTFEIVLDEGAEKKEVATLSDFSACPMHVCDGYALPGRDELMRIGQEAIVVLLEVIGSYVPRRPDDKHPVGEPDLSVN